MNNNTDKVYRVLQSSSPKSSEINTNNKLVNIGKVLKSHGVKGELKLFIANEYKSFFKNIKSLCIDGIEYCIEKARVSDFVYLILNGIDNKNLADSMQDKCVYVSKGVLPELQQYEYYFDDICGSDVYLDDILLGSLIDMGQYGTADVHVVKTTDGKIVRYPFLKKIICSIDVSQKKIVYNKQEFLKVCVEE
ncbi:MAG: ribosome maturation factor RimM [Firmicutes bacterium]|nr:ribosome maturation factor RimM [Bacillota bacterium]